MAFRAHKKRENVKNGNKMIKCRCASYNRSEGFTLMVRRDEMLSQLRKIIINLSRGFNMKSCHLQCIALFDRKLCMRLR